MSRLFLTIIILLLVSACTTKPGVDVNVNATSHSSDSSVLFSQPF